MTKKVKKNKKKKTMISFSIPFSRNGSELFGSAVSEWSEPDFIIQNSAIQQNGRNLRFSCGEFDWIRVINLDPTLFGLARLNISRLVKFIAAATQYER